MSRPAQDRPHLRGTPCAEQPPAVHDRHTAGQREGVLQPVLRQHDRRPQLPVDFPQRRQKVCRCNGIKLTGRFVQNEHTGLHRHDRRQIQELLLPAGQLRDVLVEPGLNAEKGGHLSHPAPDGRRVIPQALQAKGEFVPHLVGDNLVFGVLLHKADSGALLPLIQFFQRAPLETDASQPSAVGRQHRLELSQKRGLATPRRAAQHQEFPLLHGQC